MNHEINQAVHQSAGSDVVELFLHEDELCEDITYMINEGQISQMYYDEDGNIVAQDIWGETHENLLK